MYPSEIFDKFKETAVTVYSFTAKFVGLLVKNPLATGAAGVSILTALSVLCRWLQGPLKRVGDPITTLYR